ncbi:SDR family oxidoreductase [Variovorax sp. J22R115]|uniref:SDR family oxidoreductase n=1 Tax=Variovorax sp. J22R115 TaxID=3053509 RepID=UPI00257492B5|nr:SDR family oxidoreductase [Variovorax sp. J22R115]MDM0049858.1 SDR family oxidoreductase [Variovorax sp. J22R115]
MKIAVIGGSGLIGMKLVHKLHQRGHHVIAASPSTGVDTLAREDLADALAGAMVLVDVADPSPISDAEVMHFFETSTRNVLAAGQAAGVRHHVTLSVVGAERLHEIGYLRAKLAQEKKIKAALVAYTIVRATQFFEFAGSIADAATEGDAVRLPPARVQPMAADDVAEALAEVAAQAAVNRIIEIAGPVAMGLDEFVGQFLRANQDARKVVVDPDAPYFGAALDDQAFTPGKSPRLGKTRLADWLDRTVEKR